MKCGQNGQIKPQKVSDHGGSKWVAPPFLSQRYPWNCCGENRIRICWQSMSQHCTMNRHSWIVQLLDTMHYASCLTSLYAWITGTDSNLRSIGIEAEWRLVVKGKITIYLALEQYTDIEEYLRYWDLWQHKSVLRVVAAMSMSVISQNVRLPPLLAALPDLPDLPDLPALPPLAFNPFSITALSSPSSPAFSW